MFSPVLAVKQSISRLLGAPAEIDVRVHELFDELTEPHPAGDRHRRPRRKIKHTKM